MYEYLTDSLPQVLPTRECILTEVHSFELHAVSMRPRNVSLLQLAPAPVQWQGSMQPLVLRKYKKGVFTKAREERDRERMGMPKEAAVVPTAEQLEEMKKAVEILFPTASKVTVANK